MKLTSAMIKQRGMELGLDGVGIASIDRFEKAPAADEPQNLFPGREERDRHHDAHPPRQLSRH